MPTFSAPAKVNLGLRVLGRRPDGYHLLESLFVPLDLADEVELEASLRPAGPGAAGLDLELELLPGCLPGDAVPAGAENLAARAASRFCEVAGLTGRVRIGLLKRIPAGAGLGGGSSDAGAVLKGLSRLHPRLIEANALGELALELGADVPFFLHPRPCLVSGIGERQVTLEALPDLWLLLANPGIPLSTREVFRAFDALGSTLTPSEPGSTMRALENLAASGTVGSSGMEALTGLLDSGLLRNDLEPAARRLCPPVARLQEKLRSLGASWVGMTGSGATVFGIFGTGKPAEAAARAALANSNFEPPVWARVARSAAV
jgi:4-diphosphocytidyl-2-C-methyl-D-erythritol kinase